MSSGVASEVSEDSNGSSTSWGGIEAKDLGSLLVQFEDASQSLDGVKCPSPVSIPNSDKLKKVPEQRHTSCKSQLKSVPKKSGNALPSSSSESTPPPSPLPEVLEKIRARRKRKLAIMLPIMMANLPKKGNVRQSASTESSKKGEKQPATSVGSPSKIQKTTTKTRIANVNLTSTTNQNMAHTTNVNMVKTANQNVAHSANQNMALIPKPNMAIVVKPNMAVVPKPDMSVVSRSCSSVIMYEYKTSSKACLNIQHANTCPVDNANTGVGNPVLDHDYCSAVSSLLPYDNEVEITLDADTDIDISCVDNEVVISDQLCCDAEVVIDNNSSETGVPPTQDFSVDFEDGEVIEDGNNNMCDSVLDNKEYKTSEFKKTTTSKRGGKRQYRGRREESPMHDSDKYFDKLPSYCTDLSIPTKPPKKKAESSNKITLHDYISRDPSPNRDSNAMFSKLPAYHSCFTNSTRYDNSCPSTEPVIPIEDEYPPTSCRRTRLSRSRSYSRSRSRSRGRDRSKRRRSYSSESGSSSSSGSWSYSSSSCSSRSRSRSSSRDSRYSATSRSRSRDRFRAERKRQREAEKQKQIEERRIVYVGKIPDGHTRKQLRSRFNRFGEIENISTHFRQKRDNYGFVTFAYTCDAYAAIEKGNDIPGEQKFDLCFGGRREFCDVDYMDLDGNTEFVEEYAPQPQPSASLDFDQLLKRAQQKLKKK